MKATPASKDKQRVTQTIAGQEVSFSSLDKLYWPDEHITKGDLIDYYQTIADVIMPYLADRPQSLFRNPDGIAKSGFFQKDVTNAPDWVRTIKLRAEARAKM